MPKSKNNAARRAKRAKMMAQQTSIHRKMEAVESKSSSSNGANNNNNGNGLRSNVVTAAPVSFSKRMGFGGSNGKSNSFRVQKREYITSVDGSVNFHTAKSFHINPGLKESFPWLYETAAKWQQYRFHRFRVLYISRSSTSASGSVIISPEYNVSDGPPQDKREALDTQDAVTDNSWKELQCDMDISAMFGIGPRKQVRRTLVSTDLATYDSALVSICTDGQSFESPIGEIWFEYDVEFFVPQSTQMGSQYLSSKVNVYQLTSNTVVTSGSNVIMTAWTANGPNALNISQVLGTYNLMPGLYRVDFLSGVTWGNTSSSSEVQALIYKGGLQYAFQQENTESGLGGYGGAVSMYCPIVFAVDGVGDSLTFNISYNNTAGLVSSVNSDRTYIIFTLL